MANNLVIYAQGGDYSSLYNSGFTTVILNSFHLQTDGSIYFNDTEVVRGSGQPAAGMSGLKSTISGLLQHGIKNVLCSIGGGGEFAPNRDGINGPHSVSDNDFKNFASTFWSAVGMSSGLGNDIPVLGALQALLTNSGATGIDLDPEPMFYTYESMASAVAILTEWAAQQSVTVTWAPFEKQPSWLAYLSLLSGGSSNAMPTWINLQPPAYGDYTPQSWAANGVTSSQLVPGFGYGGTPAQALNQLQFWSGTGEGRFTGAFVWNLDGLVVTPRDWVKALNAGLDG